MFSVISTIRFCVLQRFSDFRFWARQCFMQLQPSDFEHFNVLGNFNHQILRSSMFSVISTVRFCVLQRFRDLQPSDFEHFNVLGELQPSDYAYFNVFATSTVQVLHPSILLGIFNHQIYILQSFMRLQPLDCAFFSVLVIFNHKILSTSMF